MAATDADILAGVQQLSTLEDSLIQIIQNAVNATGADQATRDQIMQIVTDNITKATAAVTANTPAAPPTA